MTELNNKKIRLLIACHKKCEVPSDPVYLPLHVGAEGKESFGFTGDNTGDNISTKNPVYCELTGLYWAWKNLDCDYLGLVHYRRYFTLKSKREQKKLGLLQSVLTGDELRGLLVKYRVLVPKRRHYYIETVYSHYAHTFDGSQLDHTREILVRMYPDYVSEFDRFMKQTSAYIFNMFVMPKDLADAYFAWLFSILSELEKVVDTSGMTPFDARYAGRVSERLFNVWLMHQVDTGGIQKGEIGEVPYLYLGKIDWKRKITGFLGAKFLHRKYEKSF
ncbi:MAG: DUF4422 domain-containing protein [Bilifractor sp.]